MPTTALSLILDGLRRLGADGLANSDGADGPCGCSTDDPAPCECLDLDRCVAARRVRPDDPGYLEIAAPECAEENWPVFVPL